MARARRPSPHTVDTAVRWQYLIERVRGRTQVQLERQSVSLTPAAVRWLLAVPVTSPEPNQA
jgi:hypothetical protein